MLFVDFDYKRVVKQFKKKKFLVQFTSKKFSL